MRIFSDCKTNKDQGNIGLTKALHELQLLGYRISIPITENQKYDLICDKNDKLYRVQVKTTKYKSKHGIYYANLRTLGGNQSYHTVKKHKKGDYDLLYALTDDNTSYLIPDDSINVVNAIPLNKSMDKYKINVIKNEKKMKLPIAGRALYYLEIVEEPNTQKQNRITILLKRKIIPEEIKDKLVDFLNQQPNLFVTSDKLNEFLKENTNYTLDDWEDFDRNKHMTEEERKKSDSLKINLKDSLNL